MNSKKLLIVIFLMAALAQFVQSKGYVIPVGLLFIDATSTAYSQVRGGDTLYFAAGNRDYLLLKNFQGSASNPIVMINQGGDVIIDTNHHYGISVLNCRYIKLTGTGFPGMMYGFKIKRVANGAGLSFGNLSSDFEADHISIENTLIGGLYAKTDPDCTQATQRANFTQYNTIIHDMYIARTGDEGMYIGSTKYAGQTVTCNGIATLLYPSVLEGVKVYNNIVEYAGWDGIQVSSATKNCQIYNNTVRFDSQDGHDTQMSGIILGGGTKADCFNNYIADGKGVGIECHGLGGSRIFNNIIVNPGLTYFPANTSLPKHGLYISDNSVQADSSFYIFNNTIVNPKSDGIRFASVKSKGNLISSNVIINPGNFNLYETDNTSFTGNDSYVMIQQAATVVTLKNNYFQRNGSAAGFVSQNMHDAENFALVAGSPLIDAADINPKATTTFDFLMKPRPSGAKSDIGAYEFSGSAQPVTATGGIIGPDQNICIGGSINPITNLTSPTNLTGTIQYKWQFSTTGSTTAFIDIVSANSDSYYPENLNITSWFRRLAKDESMTDWTNAAKSNVVTITVNPLPSVSPIVGANTMCLGSTTQLANSTVGGIWSSSDPLTASVSSTGVVTGLNAGSAEILYTVNTQSGCRSAVAATIAVNGGASQPGDFTYYSSTVKRRQNDVYYAVPVVAGVTYQWSYSGRGATLKPNGNGVYVSFDRNATPGTLSVTASNGCGKSIPRSISISVLKDAELPEANLPGDPTIPEFKNTLKVYPNAGTGPFTFEFQITEDAKVTLDIYTITGQRVAAIFNENIQAGIVRTVNFDQPLSSGVYPCIMRWKGEVISMKLIVRR